MGEPFVGEIRMFGGNFAPAGWMFCNGQLLPISENETLFNLIGTTYGGDGQSTFALPNLQSRVPIHAGTGSDGITYTQAEMIGVESVTLTTNQIPIHTHTMIATAGLGTATTPAGNILAQCAAVKMYSAANPTTLVAKPQLASAPTAASQSAPTPAVKAAAPAPAAAARPAPTGAPGAESDQVAAATTIRPLPTPVPTPSPTPLPLPPIQPVTSTELDTAAPLRSAAAIVGVLAALTLLATVLVRHRLQAASAHSL